MNRRAAACTSLLLALTGVGCTPREIRLELQPDVRLPDRYIHVFFADGLRKTTLDHLLDHGDLPNINKRFVLGGTRWENTIVCLPSVTYANTVALLTGVHPGTHGVIGNAWWDPAAGTSRDYGAASTYTLVNDDFTAPTIHEQLHPLATANILCPTHRGAAASWMHPVGTGIDWLLGDYESVNQRSARSITDIADHANQSRRWPALTVQYFPGVDETAHRLGSSGEDYDAIVRALDRQIGEVAAAIDASPLRDRTTFALVTDHSHMPAPIERRIDLKGVIERKLGTKLLPPRPKKSAADFRLRHLPANAILANVASRVAHFHIPPVSSSDAIPTATAEQLIAALLEQECVDLVCVPNPDGTIVIHSRRGHAILRRTPRGYAYLPTSGDPLGYTTVSGIAPLLTADGASAEDWLAVTNNAHYPDTPVQLVGMFDSPRAGDVAAFAADNWLFKTTDASGHGSARSTDCVVTYFFSGAGVAPGAVVPYARNLDLVPTLRALLARPASKSENPRGLQGVARPPAPASTPAAAHFSLTPMLTEP